MSMVLINATAPIVTMKVKSQNPSNAILYSVLVAAQG